MLYNLNFSDLNSPVTWKALSALTKMSSQKRKSLCIKKYQSLPGINQSGRHQCCFIFVPLQTTPYTSALKLKLTQVNKRCLWDGHLPSSHHTQGVKLRTAAKSEFIPISWKFWQKAYGCGNQPCPLCSGSRGSMLGTEGMAGMSSGARNSSSTLSSVR